MKVQFWCYPIRFKFNFVTIKTSICHNVIKIFLIIVNNNLKFTGYNINYYNCC